VVPLHGAFGGASSWSFQVPALTGAGYKVHVPERRGHAHTRDVEGPLTYGVTARPTWWGGATGRWWRCWWPSADPTWWTGWC
jgi:pimeloyl-ACP methyl ester carboxylesterase